MLIIVSISIKDTLWFSTSRLLLHFKINILKLILQRRKTSKVRKEQERMADLSGKVKIIRLFPIIVYQDVTNSNSLRAAGAMSQSSFFFPIFPGLCRTRSIHFVLLNYLIRTHPSRWASRSLINLILAFIHLALSDCVVYVSSFSLS